ncbi:MULTISPECIES: DUF2171 domain-containing protein [Nguyenibacter]|uniref:DUF2171 domain-containing protein n=1 Tax=Nguyenibacter vanlangensis TaxID=1216886 RepID=A0A7Y7M5V2_9PROT|nr:MULTISPECIES: DUF2171 domain-containing protein [Nguyenibacter]NVN12310.1 DUF2171 domain-containing protein [Nguyenibacter vanlangensis]WRH89602.1 DUF2171 domain-containing protein [Nguyenibacter sp. L1]
MTQWFQLHSGMKIVGADNAPVGEVQEAEGGARLRLTGTDGAAHYLPLSMADAVQGEVIRLNCAASEAIAHFDTELPAGEDTT